MYNGRSQVAPAIKIFPSAYKRSILVLPFMELTYKNMSVSFKVNFKAPPSYYRPWQPGPKVIQYVLGARQWDGVSVQ